MKSESTSGTNAFGWLGNRNLLMYLFIENILPQFTKSQSPLQYFVANNVIVSETI